MFGSSRRKYFAELARTKVARLVVQFPRDAKRPALFEVAALVAVYFRKSIWPKVFIHLVSFATTAVLV